MKVFIIGTGNVATSLGLALFMAGHKISGVLGRDTLKVLRLSKKLNCKSYTEPLTIPTNNAFYLVAINDDAIAGVIDQLPDLKGIVVHTSGASSINLLRRFSKRGVFYPVETITKTHPRSFAKIPFCLEGSDEATFKKLMQLARTITNEIYALSSEQRSVLHVAAVFTNNFTNALLGIATEILEQQGLPPSLIKPLAISTAQNAFKHGIINSQTGPAVRNDIKTIDKHLKLLEKNNNYRKIYQLITDQIRTVHHKQ